MERGVPGESGRRDGWLPDVPVVVVAAQESVSEGPAQDGPSVQA